MTARSEFSQRLSQEPYKHWERAVAFLWFYRQSQEYEERTAPELSNDMSEEGFPHANVTRLRDDLLKTRFVVRGHRKDSFRINLKYLTFLTNKYKELLHQSTLEVEDSIIPFDWITGTRNYLEKIVYQINGSYQIGFYDSCIVLARRLMESLIIEIYISKGQASEIKHNGVFFQLDNLIKHICSDKNIVLSRNIPSIMKEIKDLGDTAAHDRVYITHKYDIDDIKPRLRRLINELLSLSGIRP